MTTDNETLRTFLDRKEQELTQRLAAIQAELARQQAELDEIRRARSALVTVHTVTVEDRMSVGDNVQPTVTPLEALANTVLDLDVAGSKIRRAIVEAVDKYPFLEFERLTIKELVVKALMEHFPRGATAAELGEFFRNAYGRVVDRTSLSPKLSSLRREGWVDQLPDSVWNLNGDKRRALVMYDHPSSRKAITKGLRDEA